MGEQDWLVQIYEMTDTRAQELVAGLLTGVDGLTVSTGPSGPDHFVTVVLRDATRAQSVFQLMTSVDSKAVLIHSGTDQAVSSEPPAPSA